VISVAWKVRQRTSFAASAALASWSPLLDRPTRTAGQGVEVERYLDDSFAPAVGEGRVSQDVTTKQTNEPGGVSVGDLEPQCAELLPEIRNAHHQPLMVDDSLLPEAVQDRECQERLEDLVAVETACTERLPKPDCTQLELACNVESYAGSACAGVDEHESLHRTWDWPSELAQMALKNRWNRPCCLDDRPDRGQGIGVCLSDSKAAWPRRESARDGRSLGPLRLALPGEFLSYSLLAFFPLPGITQTSPLHPTPRTPAAEETFLPGRRGR